MTRPLNIALVGFGNIGTGVVRHLGRFGHLINQRLPRPLTLKWICDKDTTRDRGVDLCGARLTPDFHDIENDPEVEIVIELVGGTGIARDIVARSLRAGKHVVTANKALISLCGPDLSAMAAEHGAHLLYEASVGAGIPLFSTLHRGLGPDRITGIYGILNGTCNYILSAMEDATEISFAEHLAEAQLLGYAEPDPTLDISGMDSAHKISILASIAFGMDVRLEHVRLDGIERITPREILWAKAENLTIKLLATAALDRDGAATVSVLPTLIPTKHMLGQVRGVYNAFWIDSEPMGSTMLFGRGAGADATSGGILADVMLIAQAGDAKTIARLHPLKVPVGQRRLAPEGSMSKHYFRVCHRGDTREIDHLAPIIAGNQVAAGKGWAAFVTDRISEAQAQETLGRLTGLGIVGPDICHLRFALDGQ